jgi:hypothetical protein
MITNVRIAGGFAQAVDENHRVVGGAPADELIGYTGRSFTVRRGQWVSTYLIKDGGGLQQIDQQQVRQQTISRDVHENSHNVTNTAAAGAVGALVGSTVGRASGERRPDTLAVMLVLFAIGVGIVIVNSPGMLMVALIQNFLSVNWDTAQMWIFSLVGSVLAAAAFYILTRNLRKAVTQYAIVCGLVVLICLVGAIGIKASFFRTAADQFFPRSTTTANPNEASRDRNRTAQSEGGSANADAVHSELGSRAPQFIYRVNGLRLNDVLNMRQGPGSDYPIVKKLPSNAVEIISNGQRVTNGATVWQQVTVNGVTGWVNADFITQQK